MELQPRITEKSYSEEAKHTYVFRVPAGASKQAIAQAVAEAFKVTVTDVRTLVRKGKKTRFSKGKHAYPGTTFRQDKHLAYVTVKEGDKIPVFEDTSEQAEGESNSSSQTNAATSDGSKGRQKQKKESTEEKGDKK
jgi:large subunit ribosomal protein L23